MHEEQSPSCCKKVVHSCCDQQENENEEEPSPFCGDCGCTIKGTIFAQDWAPPVDFIVDASRVWIGGKPHYGDLRAGSGE
ncbi:hypothetical protein H8D29_04660 [PVC group bacterium]|nr:hypothetical protein [PVC group bacterium]